MKKILLSLFCILCFQISANATTIVSYSPANTVITTTSRTIYSPPYYLGNGINFSLGIGNSGIFYTSYPRYYRHHHHYYHKHHRPHPPRHHHGRNHHRK